MDDLTVEEIAAEQAIDRELDRDYEIGSLIRSERKRTGEVRINALEREQYYSRRRPDRNLRSHHGQVIHSEPDEPYDRGEDRHDPGPKPVQAYRPSPAVSHDLVAEGHGFSVRKVTTNPDVPEVCRYCGDRLLGPDERWPCEFEIPIGQCYDGARATVSGSEIVSTHEIDGVRFCDPVPLMERQQTVQPRESASQRECQCNGCARRRMGSRKRGGQAVQCGKPECEKKKKSDQNARDKERARERDRLAAIEVIRCEPHRSDKEIAADLGIRPKRVREAREKLSS